MPIDLTPFGYTPTESLAYEALLALGPASGYAVAREISVARANAYQALHGLVGKGAAALIDENPLRFRAVRPDALLAAIAGTQAGRLAELERQVRAHGRVGAEAIVAITDERGLLEILTRWAGRAAGEVRCVAPQHILDALQPVWRKRDVDGTPTLLQPATPPADPGLPGADAVLFWCDEAAVVAAVGDETRGHWFSDVLMTATIRAAIDRINQTVE